MYIVECKAMGGWVEMADETTLLRAEQRLGSCILTLCRMGYTIPQEWRIMKDGQLIRGTGEPLNGPR